MSERVAIIARVVAQRDGQIELERLVTPEMAERMRRDNESEKSGQARATGRRAMQEVRSVEVETLPARSGHRPGKL